MSRVPRNGFGPHYRLIVLATISGMVVTAAGAWTIYRTYVRLHVPDDALKLAIAVSAFSVAYCVILGLIVARYTRKIELAAEELRRRHEVLLAGQVAPEVPIAYEQFQNVSSMVHTLSLALVRNRNLMGRMAVAASDLGAGIRPRMTPEEAESLDRLIADLQSLAKADLKEFAEEEV